MTEEKERRPYRYFVFLNMVCLEPTENLLRMKAMIETEIQKRETVKEHEGALTNLWEQLKKVDYESKR